MSKKLTRRVTTKHKVKIHDNRPLPEPAESMVAPVLAHPVRHERHGTHHPFGQKVSPLSMAEISSALPTTRSSAIYSQSSNASKTESRNTSRSTFCSGYDSADDSGTFIGLHDLGSDFGESGTSFMSWSDEIDNDTTKKLQDMYDGLEKFLYDEAEFPSNAGKDLLEECLIWKDTFPYKRPEAEAPSPVEPERDPTGQEALRLKVGDLVLENLSSNLLSRVIDTVAVDLARLRDESAARPLNKAVRSRSSSPAHTRMPAIDATAGRSKMATLDRCLGSGMDAGRLPPSAFTRSLPHENLSLLPLQLPRVLAHSAIPRCENYPSPPTDRTLAPLGSAFAGRKSPRQETILRNIAEERRKHGNNNNNNTDNPRVPTSHKPPWIGFANITLPPIQHPEDRGSCRRNSSSLRTRKVSPSPPRPANPTAGRGGHSPTFDRLHAAKKIAEHRAQQGPSRKANKYVVN